MDNQSRDCSAPDYTWLLALGVMSISMTFILCGPAGMVFLAARGMTTGIALCTGLAYLVLNYLPEKYR